MRILQVCLRHDGGGAERAIHALALEWEKDVALDVEVVAIDPPRLDELGEGLPVLNATGWSGCWRIVTAVIGLRRFLRQARPQVLHAHCETPELVVLLTLLSVSKRNRPNVLVITEHTSRPWTDFPRLGSWVRRILNRYDPEFVAVAGDSGYSRHIPNPGRKFSLREADESHVSQFVLISRLASFKQVDIALEALKRTGLLSRTLVIGDGPERPALEAQFGKGPFVGFRQDPWREIASTDVYISASSYEGEPLSVLEAVSAGMPVLLSRISAHERLVGHEHPGLFDDVEELATLIKKAEQYPQHFCPGEHIRSTVAEMHSAERIAKIWAALYRDLVHN